MTPAILAEARDLAVDALHAYKEREGELFRARADRRMEVIERRNVRLFVEHAPGTAGGAQKVVFAGSDDVWDWIRNISAWRVARTGMGRVHKGVADCYACVRPALERAVDPRRPITFAGHSQGGALAQFAAARCAATGLAVRSVHAFGAPMVGDADWAEFYDSCAIDTHCWVAGWDRIPLQPSLGGLNLGYRRVSGWHFIGLDGSLLSSSPGLLAGRPWRTWTRRKLNHGQETYVKALGRIRLS